MMLSSLWRWANGRYGKDATLQRSRPRRQTLPRKVEAVRTRPKTRRWVRRRRRLAKMTRSDGPSVTLQPPASEQLLVAQRRVLQRARRKLAMALARPPA